MAFDQVIADRICELIAEGITLREILRRNPDFPKWRTVHLWRNERPEFEAAYREARRMGFDAIAEETIEIADDGSNDWTVRQKGEETVSDLDGEHVQRSKLRIDTRLKLLAKWDPARYGEKLAIGGADDLPPLKTMSDDQLEARIAALQARINGGKG